MKQIDDSRDLSDRNSYAPTIDQPSAVIDSIWRIPLSTMGMAISAESAHVKLTDASKKPGDSRVLVTAVVGRKDAASDLRHCHIVLEAMPVFGHEVLIDQRALDHTPSLEPLPKPRAASTTIRAASLCTAGDCNPSSSRICVAPWASAARTPVARSRDTQVGAKADSNSGSSPTSSAPCKAGSTRSGPVSRPL